MLNSKKLNLIKEINLKESCRVLYKAFNLFGKYKKIYLFGLLLSSAKYAIKFINPITYKFIADIILGNISGNGYMQFIGILSLFIILMPLFCFGHYLRSVSCIKAQTKNQKVIFEHLLKLPIKEVNQQSSGVYLTKLADDMLFVDRIFKKYVFTALGKFIIFTTVSFIFLINVSFKVFFISLILGLVFLGFNLFVIPKIRKLELSIKESATQLHSYIIDFLNNILLIRIFEIEKALKNKFSHEVAKIAKNRVVSKSIIGAWAIFIDLIKIVIQPLSIIFILFFIPNELSIPDVVFISGIISVYVEGLCNFIFFFQNIQNDLICAKRVLDLLDCEEEKYLNDNLQNIENLDQECVVEFKDVNFSYKEGKIILENFSLKVRKNQIIAIVGESGGGKSTILKLLQGFYNDYTGQILLNGKAIEKYNLNVLRDKFSYISQENLLFNESIENNIKLIKGEVGTEEYSNAVKFAKLELVIRNIKENQIGKNGCMLSGGEKQRISIARAFLKNADIFLFDEFTSALDKDTEKEIFTHLEYLIGKKTIIMVTHRLNYIENADCIIFVKDGKIIESGTHQELINKNKYYKALYDFKY